MIHLTEGNLLEADVEALVNTVNTVGVMGKGIALQFKQAFPHNFKVYKQACDAGEVRLGEMFVVNLGRLTNPRYIINFPTKGHWRARSRIDDVRNGLEDLARVSRELGIESIAVPPLGCGNGGLEWKVVEPLIEAALGDLDLEVRLYAPAGPPQATSMPVNTTRPNMTRGRAALLVLADRYDDLGLGVSQIELQKLMYFLQEFGEDLRLDYKRAWYGPYADNLNHVLQRIEGHFVRGYGDRTRAPYDASPLDIQADAVAEAERFLADEVDLNQRIDRVLTMVRGFESPYGLELLATLHWLVAHEQVIDNVGDDEIEKILEGEVASWSQRKGRLFSSQHLRAAWNQLRDGPALEAAAMA